MEGNRIEIDLKNILIQNFQRKIINMDNYYIYQRLNIKCKKCKYKLKIFKNLFN